MVEFLFILTSFIIIIGLLYFYRLKTNRRSIYRGGELQMEQIISFIKENGGSHLSHLILLQDKDVFWAQQQKVLIIYRQIGNKLVVLGDPLGNEALFSDAINEFHRFSERLGAKPIFYQTTPNFMHNYHDAGFRFLKLGEEGIVNLQNFTLEGKKGAKLRTRLNKFTRNGHVFRVIHPPYTDDLLTDLKRISDSWLGNQREKGFSVVSFSQEYVSSFPIALLYDPTGQIIAFATLATDCKQTLIIDLMRKSSDSPHGTMDVLFIQIFKWAKENGYQRCSLGVAPLANVGSSKYSFKSEKLLRLAYLHGSSLYKFQGLREFKSKFACTWEPKYLAYKKTTPPVVIVQLLLLINSQPHPKYVVKKFKYLFTKAG